MMDINTPMNPPSGSLLPLDTLPLETFSYSLAASSLWLSELQYSPMEETVSELFVVSSHRDITQQTTLIIPTIQARSIMYESNQNPIGQIVSSVKPASHRESRLPLAIVCVLVSILMALTILEIYYPYLLR